MYYPKVKIKALLIAIVIGLTVIACKNDRQYKKEKSISAIKQSEHMQTSVEQKVSDNKSNVSQSKEVIFSSKGDREDKNSQYIVGLSESDKIIGIWEVKNDYYMGVYEIQKHKGKYIGLLHYYNDGSEEIKGDGSEKFYFLNDVVFKDGKYVDGKMYMPDGSNYQVVFTMKNEDSVTAKMIIEDQLYTETWKRKKIDFK